MKKLLIAFFLVFVLISGSTNINFSLANYVDGEYYAYSTKPANEAVETATKYFLTTMRPTDGKAIVGEVVVATDCDIYKLLNKLQAQIVCIENDAQTMQIYAYSTKIPRQCNENGKRFNLQISSRNGKTIVGWPKILENF